jgi:hypothetical protein
MINMLKDMAWNVFKKTGNINSYLELKDIEQINTNNISSNFGNINVEQNVDGIGGLFGNNKNKGNSN